MKCFLFFVVLALVSPNALADKDTEIKNLWVRANQVFVVGGREFKWNGSRDVADLTGGAGFELGILEPQTSDNFLYRHGILTVFYKHENLSVTHETFRIIFDTGRFDEDD